MRHLIAHAIISCKCLIKIRSPVAAVGMDGPHSSAMSMSMCMHALSALSDPNALPSNSVHPS